MGSTRRPRYTATVIALTVVLAAQAFLVQVHAHHTAMRLSVPAPGCGWVDGDSLRARSNLSELCQRWIPTHLGIRMAAADHEIVQIEASPTLVAALTDGRRSVSALLHDWLQH